MRFDDEDWCCQGAAECDGIRWNSESRLMEFALYFNGVVNGRAPLDEIAWHAVYYCPLCGKRQPVKWDDTCQHVRDEGYG